MIHGYLLEFGFPYWAITLSQADGFLAFVDFLPGMWLATSDISSLFYKNWSLLMYGDAMFCYYQYLGFQMLQWFGLGTEFCASTFHLPFH